MRRRGGWTERHETSRSRSARGPRLQRTAVRSPGGDLGPRSGRQAWDTGAQAREATLRPSSPPPLAPPALRPSLPVGSVRHRHRRPPRCRHRDRPLTIRPASPDRRRGHDDRAEEIARKALSPSQPPITSAAPRRSSPPSGSGRRGPASSTQARDLLTDDAAPARFPRPRPIRRTRALLEDLELILVQIAQVARPRTARNSTCSTMVSNSGRSCRGCGAPSRPDGSQL